ncbi:MAG: TetR family transcriptional regulator [Rhodovulum sulfidophilum]|uniref:TetR family transcriptional regulator n=1 Tax=Rhodovulum sulfidophilum TaxID=35806 RepID=A0A2W5Q2H5_RHOSU|nr:MAG: TetR family transcriptional regulator [Rhodovulum sulfidophilum]
MAGTRRGRGRLAKEGEDLRGVILDAATREFSAKGFDGARVDAIAREAGVNINLVYHYFGKKEALFIAVMEEAYIRIRTHHNDTNIRALDPESAMAELVRSTFRFFRDNLYIIGLLNSENMHEACHIQQSERIQSLYDPLLGLIATTLEQGVAEGTFRPGVDPAQLFLTINAQSYFHLSNRYTMAFVLKRDLSSDEALRRREEHVLDVILSYLKHQPDN